METNVGALDRLSRAIIAVALIFVLIKSGKVSVITALMLCLSGSLLASAASGSCALYTQLGISTNE